MLPTKFRVNWPFGSGEDKKKKKKKKNQDLGFPIEKKIAIFDLQVSLMHPTWFRVNWPFGSEEVKNSFQIGRHSFV